MLSAPMTAENRERKHEHDNTRDGQYQISHTSPEDLFRVTAGVSGQHRDIRVGRTQAPM